MMKIDMHPSNTKRKIRYYLSPLFITRHGILESIKFLLNKYNKSLQNKKLLNIGCGSKPYEFLFNKLGIEYEGIDFKGYSNNSSFEPNKPNLLFSKNYKEDFKLSSFEDKSYDIVAAFEVLEHHERPEVFFSEVARILKKGGYLIITFPFILDLHEEPGDFQRFTHHKIINICNQNEMTVLEILKRGGGLSTLSQLANSILFNSKLPTIVKVLLYSVLLLPYQYIVYFSDKLFLNPERKIFLGYTFLIKRK